MTDLVTLTDPRSPVSEAYRSLRTNLAFARPDEELRTLLVTSPAPEEERSATVANLAVVSAQSGRTVIIADCDLRRPSQHTLFGLDNEAGVTTALLDDDVLAAPPLQETGVEGLRVLTSGPVPPNPAELLGSRRMGALVSRLAADADLVLFEAPPLVPVTDGAVLAPLLDGTLLVLAAGSSRRDQTERAREILDNVGARLVGVVLTDVDPDEAGYGYYGADKT
ncbi:MAG: CpsD/CapB family tyrosine-protein kinase [Anaerolineae bacterium]